MATQTRKLHIFPASLQSYVIVAVHLDSDERSGADKELL